MIGEEVSDVVIYSLRRSWFASSASQVSAEQIEPFAELSARRASEKTNDDTNESYSTS